MADIHCPMCGKPNPEELDICQFCQARLKPLIIKPHEPEEDWLKAAGDESSDDRSDKSQPEAPDWLRSLRSRAAPLEDENEDEGMSDPAEWLRAGLDDPELLGVQRPASQTADWLDEFRSNDSDEEPLETTEFPLESETEESTQSGIPAEIEASLPDWLASSRVDNSAEIDEPEADLTVPPVDDAEPEWLARIRASRSTEPEDDFPEPSADQEDLPDWLKSADLDLESEGGALTQEAAPGTETPDWTSYIDQTGSSSGFDAEASEQNPAGDDESSVPEDDVPDWLKEGSQQPETEAPVHPVENSLEAEPVNDTPPWYATTPGRPFKPTDQLSQWLKMETSGSEISPEKPAEEIPDRLKTRAETPSPQKSPTGPDSGEDSSSRSEDMPDSSSDAYQNIEPPEPPYPPAGEDAFPDDEFARLEKELFSEIDQEKPAESQPSEGELVTGNEPSWLIELRQKMGESGELMASKVAPFSEDVEQDLPPEEYSGQELPDWLIDVHAQEAIEQISEASVPVDDGTEEVVEAGAGLAQADLPTWLEAMRPVEAVAAAASDLVDERDQSIETAGPLAGIRGVLQAEADVPGVHKPGSFGLKLEVSDMQRARAEMLEELIQNESAAKPVPRKPSISSHRISQIIFAAVLILAILSTLIIDTPIAKTPGFPAETGAVSDTISSLSSSDRVLVAVDYQPAFSGEMDAAGATVLDHLMLRGVHLVLVSTNPSGPLQAERLINLTNQRYDHTYGDEQVTNLGYISGGRAGILAFASAPRQLAPVTLDSGTNPWEGGALQGITQASDFALTVVITESPENSRSWIEQFEPELGEKPLIMVLSAQAEAIVRPYYEGSPQQVQGIVSGTIGAAAYENLLGRAGIARNHWGAYSLGVLAACVLILLGGFVSIFQAIASRLNKTTSGGADQL